MMYHKYANLIEVVLVRDEEIREKFHIEDLLL